MRKEKWQQLGMRQTSWNGCQRDAMNFGRKKMIDFRSLFQWVVMNKTSCCVAFLLVFGQCRSVETKMINFIWKGFQRWMMRDKQTWVKLWRPSFLFTCVSPGKSREAHTYIHILCHKRFGQKKDAVVCTFCHILCTDKTCECVVVKKSTKNE